MSDDNTHPQKLFCPYWKTDNLALEDTKIQAMLNERSLCIWFIHDEKPGHIHQLQGLEERIANYANITSQWIDASKNKLSILDVLLEKKPNTDKLETNTPFKPPNIVIGAGHSTHKTLLFHAKIHNAYCAVLMKPSLPLCLFDAVICPKHDNLKENKRVLNTYGAINTIKPTNHKHEKTVTLILIGGPSKHYNWQDEDILNQIELICSKHDDKQWILSDSPRTPPSFIKKLKTMAIQNLSCHHFQDNTLEPLNTLMQKCAITWVTPDSVSMLYESLTASSSTYTFTMPLKKVGKPTRVAKSINHLISQEQIIGFQSWKLHPDTKPNKLALWEADRAAKWLLHQYIEKHPQQE